MNEDKILRENLLALMTGEHSRTSFENVVREFPSNRINENFPNADYSPWDLLEHIRLAQEDILDFIKNPNYRERGWPAGYWPKKGKKATPADWKKTIDDFKRDFKELQNLIKDPKNNLYRGIPWQGGEITFLREIITVANHNAFHLGEFAMMRQAMGTWGKAH
ncbi:MAG: DinB family protein [Chloroflexota bacterium]